MDLLIHPDAECLFNIPSQPIFNLPTLLIKNHPFHHKSICHIHGLLDLSLLLFPLCLVFVWFLLLYKCFKVHVRQEENKRHQELSVFLLFFKIKVKSIV